MSGKVVRHPNAPSSPQDVVHELLNHGARLHKVMVAYEWVDDDGILHTVTDWSSMDLTELTWLHAVLAARCHEKIADRLVNDSD